jgi:hypothetical protein
MRLWAISVLALVLAAPLAAGRAYAQADADADGVADELDACPDTAMYDMVDTTGCNVCDCEKDAAFEPWTSRGAYLRCIQDEVRIRKEGERLTRQAARLVVKAARNSTCGQPTKVRCCIMFVGRDEGICRVMDELRCDGALLRADTVDDLGPGSCFPNPCVH